MEEEEEEEEEETMGGSSGLPPHSRLLAGEVGEAELPTWAHHSSLTHVIAHQTCTKNGPKCTKIHQRCINIIKCINIAILSLGHHLKSTLHRTG